MIHPRFRTIAVAAVVLAACSVAPLTATASPPSAVAIEMHATGTGAVSAQGTWVATGEIEDEGTYVETVRSTGNTTQFVKTLTGANGTIVIEVKAVAMATSSGARTVEYGRWRIAAGTGAYATLKGGGCPVRHYGVAYLPVEGATVTHEGFVKLH
jgi:Trk-type K+ transport system membrane component